MSIVFEQSKPSVDALRTSDEVHVPSPGSSQSGSRGRAAVVGSGFGGLAAAIRLQAMGFETTCFEGRDKPGGRAYVYEDDGFTFDAGPDRDHSSALHRGAVSFGRPVDG